MLARVPAACIITTCLKQSRLEFLRSTWGSLPDACAVESESDECAAAEIGRDGIEIMPLDVRRRVLAMWEAAQQIASREDMPRDASKDLLLTLLQGRVPLVTNDDDMTRARIGAAQLIANAIPVARNRGEHHVALSSPTRRCSIHDTSSR